LAQAIASAQAELAGEPIRWVQAETLHLTLRFLGETAPPILDRMRDAAATIAARCRSFDLEVRGLGCFPEPRRPRIVWAGAQDESGSLLALAEALEALARRHGWAAERRPFSAHLTLGRVKDAVSEQGSRRLEALLERSRTDSYGIVPVGEIQLVRSDLRPAGPVYTRLAALALMA
jgi:2'-5' RNA ligase